jgi:hypothetical protein
MKKWIKYTAGAAFGIIITGGLAASITFNVINMKKLTDMQQELTTVTDKLNTTIAGINGNGSEFTDQENDVPIGGGVYTIRDTSNISNAYKSGDTSSLTEDEKKTLDAASNLLDSIITDGMTDYEKEVAVYEWLCTNVTTDFSSTIAVPDPALSVDQPLGVLTNHAAVCVGYATTFRLLMNMMDIECMVVHDTYLSHSWDLVNIDGGWYHVDVYSDAASGEPTYADFNMTDDICSGTGHDYYMSILPAANATEYCYAITNSEKIDSIYDIPDSIVSALGNGSQSLFYSMDDGFSDEDATAIEYMVNYISNYYNTTNRDYYISSVPCRNNDEIVAYEVSISYYGDEILTPDSDNVDYDKAAQAVADAFGISTDELFGSISSSDYTDSTMYEDMDGVTYDETDGEFYDSTGAVG